MICCNMATICNVLGFLVGAFVTTFVLLASDVQPLVFRRPSIVGEVWTAAKDLAPLARTEKLSAAVTRLTSAAYESGAPVLQVEGIQDVIDAATEEDMRTALLMEADVKGSRKKDPLAAFASTDNAAATCEASGTAGADGLDSCVARCERKPSLLDFRTPREGACYLLCSLAIAPCTHGLFSWGTSAKNWGVPRRSVMTPVKNHVAMRVEMMTPAYNSMAVQVETMASLVHAKGMDMARGMQQASTAALADLSFWIFAAMDAIRTSTTLQVVLLLVSCGPLGAYILMLHKQLKVAREEVKRIKLNQLFKIRARLLNREGFYAVHDYGAWAIYHASVKADKAERKKASCRLLGRLVSGRSKRAAATRFARWKVTAATRSAAVDAASSEADAKDGEDKVAG